MNYLSLFLLIVGVISKVSGDYCSDALDKHNAHRQRHQSGELTCNDEISKDAQAYANKLAKNCDFKHSENSKYGENLYMAGGSKSPPSEKTSAIKSVDSWYSEEKCYDYDNPGFKSCKNTKECNNCVVGHFTALVWKNTAEVGVGVAKCQKKKNGYFWTIVVANYKEPGNYEGQFEENVLRPE